MNNTNNINYIFHCGEYETERSFKEGTDESYIDQAFDEWIYEQGLGCDEIEDMIAEGEAGYYEV